jgi:hypothetical protein
MDLRFLILKYTMTEKGELGRVRKEAFEEIS